MGSVSELLELDSSPVVLSVSVSVSVEESVSEVSVSEVSVSEVSVSEVSVSEVSVSDQSSYYYYGPPYGAEKEVETPKPTAVASSS